MADVLIVEDNKNIQMEVSTYFQRNGMNTICPMEFSEIIPLVMEADAVLLDINLGTNNGFDICKKIRLVSAVPILFITGREGEEDELKALAIGGDDYIRKPFSLPVLFAKVKRILERGTQKNVDEFQCGPVYYHAVTGQIQIENQTLELTKNENKILYFLFLHQDRIVSKNELIEFLWVNKLYVDENILNVNLSRLRKRLETIGCPDFIVTVPKMGYRIKEIAQ